MSIGKYYFFCWIILTVSYMLYQIYKVKNNKKNEFKVIVALEFGSSFIKFCNIFNPLNDIKIADDEDKKLIHSDFIIFETEKRIAIGIKIHFNYIDLINPGELIKKENITFFNLVDDNDKADFNYFLNEYLDASKEEVCDNDTKIPTNVPKWKITVPSVLNIKAKEYIKKNADKVGLINNEIVLDQEAVAFSVIHNETFGKKLTKEKIFLIVDLGYYTFDINVWKIMDNNKNLEQLIIPITYINGSNSLYIKVLNIIENILGIKQKQNEHHIHSENLFEEIKQKFKELNFTTNEQINLKFNIKQYKACKTKCRGVYNTKQINYDNKYIYFPYLILKEIFTDFINDKINIIKSVISKLDKNPDFVFINGGLNTNIFLRETIIKNLEKSNYEITFLDNPSVNVMMGAINYGLYTNSIIKRIVPVNIYIESYRKEGVEYILFFKRGESVFSEEEIIHKIYINEDSDIKIYYSFEDNENEVLLLKILELPDNIEGDIILKMKFNSNINATIIDKKTNYEKNYLIFYPYQEL